VAERDPIDRHFMLSELGKCLYASREAFASALDEFDAVCVQHHSEMDVIRAALAEKFGRVPVIEMYRQAAIRCQKAHDWPQVRLWADRGLAVYGTEAARPQAVDDLKKRLAHADMKIAAVATSSAKRTSVRPARGTEVETLACSTCGVAFQRVRTRGRKPHRCPACRTLAEE
jgi:predicted Zn-ribbon and HTH transcriptional regulator